MEFKNVFCVCVCMGVCVKRLTETNMKGEFCKSVLFNQAQVTSVYLRRHLRGKNSPVENSCIQISQLSFYHMGSLAVR